MKVKIVNVPWFDNTRLYMPGTTAVLSDPALFSHTCMVSLEKDAAPTPPAAPPVPAAPAVVAAVAEEADDHKPPPVKPAAKPGYKRDYRREYERRRKRERLMGAAKKAASPAAAKTVAPDKRAKGGGDVGPA